MNIVSIVGARPQFVKASVVSHALKKADITEFMINTGQHYDDNMSQVFFQELGISQPDVNLGVGSGSHGRQTAASLAGIEAELVRQAPARVLVYGDTNATIAGALAAAKLQIPVDHIEAGLRSFNRTMPEEVNRILTDVLSDQLFCPTQVAVKNLAAEGIIKGVHLVGDVMVDALQHFSAVALDKSVILETLKIEPQTYVLMTIHRPSNADSSDRLIELVEALKRVEIPVVFPVHPRTLKLLPDELINRSNIQVIEPVGYLDMMMLEKQARIILTDSGGIQKEAYLHKVPCLTLRPETEWVETIQDGWNTLVSNINQLPRLIESPPEPKQWSEHYGDGRASDRIVSILRTLELN